MSVDMELDQWLLLSLLLLAACAAWHWPRRARAADERGLPRALRGVPVVFAESTFRSQRLGLVARLDRAYKHGSSIILVEFKTRGQLAVRMADVIELSVQRLALADETGFAVASIGYVVVQHARTGRRLPVRVALMDEDQVQALLKRYHELVGARSVTREPRGVEHVAMCRDCGHRDVCHRRYGMPNSRR